MVLMRLYNIIRGCKNPGLSAKALCEKYYHRKSPVCDMDRRILFDINDLVPGSREINLNWIIDIDKTIAFT
jgi:hypothetical protein